MRSSEEMVSIIFPLQFHFSTILVIFLTFHTLMNGINGSNDYEECSHNLISCGNISKIGYPFWNGYFGRPKHCGHPAMKLECSTAGHSDHKHPILLLGGDEVASSTTYQVLAISNFIITISLLDLDSSFPHCLIIPVDTQVDALVDYQHHFLTYSSNVTFISLLDCESRKDATGVNGSDLITVCSYDSQTIAYYQRSSSPESERQSCKPFNKGVPVLKKEFYDYLGGGNQTLEDVLSKGFEAKFSSNYSEACLHCRHSGGECGSSASDYSQFMCYCKNGQYDPHHCPVNSAPEPAPAVPDTSPHKRHAKITVSLAIGIPGGIFILTTLIVGVFCCTKHRLLAIFWKGRTIENQNAEAFLRICGSLAPKRYSYSSIKKMTNSFEDKLGEGGYATVYKGKLNDGRFIAVKLFKQSKGNGEDFINEVASIGRTNHVNVVSLLGFCFEGIKRALIYEFMPNGSLEKFTFRTGINRSLPWETLFNITQGVARGLEYLHRGCNERILHFDIKPHNILLDEEFRPKISDFGLARLYPQQESSISMLEARGTVGYIAPEVFYRSFGSVSHKSDVYSYGMMVLDLVCGRTNTSANAQYSSEMYFPHWIYKRLELQGEVRVDGIVNGEEEVLQRKMILVSLWCIQMDPSNRPSMSQVVEMLNGDLESITMPPKPYISSPPGLVSFPSSETSP